MSLHRFSHLIASMPVDEQAFWSNREVWVGENPFPSPIPELVQKIFNHGLRVQLSRSDLRNSARVDSPEEFAFRTILWGFPTGGRGNNLRLWLPFVKEVGIAATAAGKLTEINWHNHYNSVVTSRSGLGLSAYSKLLCFAKTSIAGYPAQILDRVVIAALNNGGFRELAPLANINYQTAHTRYVEYLEKLHEISEALTDSHHIITPEKIEMFLFTFGGTLKL